MSVDRVMVDLGLIEAGAETGDVDARIQAEALAFLRAGGVVSWDEWRRMDERTRRAFESAGQSLAVERAHLNLEIVSGIFGGIGAAVEESDLDRLDAIERALDRAAERIL